MNKFTLIFLIICLVAVNAEPPRPRKPFRSLPARFQSRFLGRQEAAPPGNGYNYPKPDYGLPSEPELPTTEAEPEFVTAEAEAGGDPDIDPNITNESDVNERLQQALKKSPRIVYLGLPEHQVHFDDVVFDSHIYPYDLTHSHYYEPYVSAVEVVSIPEPRLKSFSSQSVKRLF